MWGHGCRTWLVDDQLGLQKGVLPLSGWPLGLFSKKALTKNCGSVGVWDGHEIVHACQFFLVCNLVNNAHRRLPISKQSGRNMAYVGG